LAQLPQLTESDAVSTHLPEHRRNPELQLNAHLPLSQAAVPLSGAGQALPQPPQFATSLEGFTHEPLQSSAPG
jgi:hypothetical protein